MMAKQRRSEYNIKTLSKLIGERGASKLLRLRNVHSELALTLIWRELTEPSKYQKLSIHQFDINGKII